MAKSNDAPFRQFTPLRESGSFNKRTKETKSGKLYKGVTIIKAGVGNKKDRNYYPPNVLKEAAQKNMFEGLRAFADHPDSVSEEILPERSIRDIVGIYTNTRFVESGGGRVVGDLKILKSATWLQDMIDELTEMGQADKIGISINGRGKTVEDKLALTESGEELDVNRVEEFIDLRSADVVTEAGAGGGFQQLLESVRGARKEQENPMKLTAEQKKQLQEAADKDDLETIVGVVTSLVETEVGASEGESIQEADGAEEDPDAALEEVAEAAKEGTDSTDEDDPEAEVRQAEADLEESDEDDPEDGEEEDDPEGPDANLEEAEEPEGGDELSKARANYLKALRAKKSGRTKEAGPKLANGVPTTGAGEATRPAGKKIHKGTKVHESAAYISQLEKSNTRLRDRNAELAAQLKVRTTADRAKKMLRESAIPEHLRPTILPLLVGKSEGEMRAVVNYHETLFESMLREVGAEPTGSQYDVVEGVGTRIRESRGEETGTELFQELGLPLKQD